MNACCLGLLLTMAATAAEPAENWYSKGVFLLHLDHHTQGTVQVGRDASPEETSRLVALCKPDMIQIHAKGNPGWTTYPTKIGFAPPKLQRDVLAIWRDVARHDGYAFSAYYNIGRDGEIMTRHPAWNRLGANGKPLDKALCYHSGVATEYLWPMIAEIMAGYKPDGFWFDGSCFTVQPCYCEVCRARFQKEKSVPPPKEPSQRGWSDYQEMQRQIYREFVAETIRRIHAIDPKCLVAVNWAYSLRMPEKPVPGLAYLTGDIGNRVEGLSPEAHWSDSLGLPFDLMTTVFTYQASPGDSKGPPKMTPKPAGQIEQEMAVIIANGGRYFAWDNPSPTSGLSAERFEFMGRVVAPFLRARQAWCQGTQRRPDVSLLHSAAAHYAVTDAAGPSFGKRDNRIDGATAALARLHLNYEMIPDWRLEAGDIRSRLLVVEHPKVVTPRVAEAVIRFVQQGGIVLWSGMGANSPRLRSLLGISPVANSSGPEPLQIHLGGKQLKFSHWLSRVQCDTAQALLSVTAADGKDYPFLTRNKFGRGQAFYVTLPLLATHGKEQTVPPSVVQEVFARALPPTERLLTTTAPETIEVVLRQKGDQSIVHLVNMAPGQSEMVTAGIHRHFTITQIPPVPACTVSLRLAEKPDCVRLEPEGKELTEWKHADGRLEVSVPGFPIHTMVVVKSSARNSR